MAMNSTSSEAELLHPRLSRLAGAFSCLLGLLCAAAAQAQTPAASRPVATIGGMLG